MKKSNTLSNPNPVLKFGRGNKKIGKGIYTFSLPSGWSCPFSKDCLSKADPKTGKIKDSKEMLFRCYSASMEGLRPNVRNMRWHNFNLLKTKGKDEMIDLIHDGIVRNHVDFGTIVRIHVGGDFFNQQYFDAWMEVSEKFPNLLFYAYTKSLVYWANYLSLNNTLPINMKLVASRGGRSDHLIDQHQFRESRVVYSEAEALELGLPIDTDDSLAYGSDESFALMIHGSQPRRVNQLLKQLA